MESKKKYRLIIYNLIISVIVLALMNISNIRESYDFMLIYSINSAFVFGALILLELRNFKGLNLNLPLLVGYCFRLVIPSITSAWGAMNGERFYFVVEVNSINDYMFPTIVWMNIYYMIFYWCLVRFAKNFTIEESIRPLFIRFNIVKFTIPLYTMGMVYTLFISATLSPYVPTLVSSLFGQMTKLAIIIQMFDALFNPSKFKRRLFLLFIILSVWYTIVYGFYKGSIMMHLVYYIMYIFLDCKYHEKKLLSTRFVVVCFSLILAIDFVIYPFMSTKRVVAGWNPVEGQATRDYSNFDIMVDVINGKSLVERGQNTAFDRLDAIPPNAYFYKECCTRGLRTSELLVNNLELLVPRFINPDKHNSEAGLMVYAYTLYGSFKSKDSVDCYVFIGQFASAYLIGGWLCAFILAFINGRFTIFYYNFLVKNDNNILAILLLISLLLQSILAFEEVHDGGVLNMGYNIVMVIGIYLTGRFFPGLVCVKK